VKQKETSPDFYDEDYFQRGIESGKGVYDDYGNAEGIFQRLVPIICGTFKPRKLLELGCAYGHFVKHIHQGLAIGIDFSRYAILERRMANKVLLASVTHLPFKTNTFDTIVCFETFEHLTTKQIEQCFREVDRIGTKWFCFNSPSPLPNGRVHKDKSHINELTPEEWLTWGKRMKWKYMPSFVKKIKTYRIVRVYDWNVYVFDIANE